MQWRPGPEEAFFCVALMARDADGLVRPEETALIAERLGAQLRRIGLESEMVAVAMLSHELRTNGREATLELLRSAFSSEGDARLAVELAIRVSVADRHLDPREMGLVTELGLRFGLQGDEIERLLAPERSRFGSAPAASPIG